MKILIEYSQSLWHTHSAHLPYHSFTYCYRWLFKPVGVSCSINFRKVHLAGVILSAPDNCIYNFYHSIKFPSLFFLIQRKYESNFWQLMLSNISPIQVLDFFSFNYFGEIILQLHLQWFDLANLSIISIYIIYIFKQIWVSKYF